MNTSIEFARTVLAAQPFSSLVGADITRFEPGLVTLVVPLRPDLLQQNGFVHGGVLAYAADNGITFAGGSVLGPDVLTSGVRVDYVSPVSGDIEATAQVSVATDRLAVCTCTVVSDGQVCAVAQGTVRLFRSRSAAEQDGETPSR